MIINTIAIIYLFFTQACLPPTDHQTPQAQKLLGTWYLNENDLYNKIYFQDSSHVAFDTHLDTMFFYTYRLQNDTLLLFDKKGQLHNYNIIQKLSVDSLIFNNLLDKEGIQRYSRQEKLKASN
ncbi:MAG: hypothetical protein MUE85_13710 [Microscillaceae bacterium]|nr:hypothetical protein [Microscillaceae bacterium]